MATTIKDGITSDLANVNANKQLEVNLSKTPSKMGAIGLGSINDNGAISGTPQVRFPRTNLDQRLLVDQPTLLDSNTFNYTAQHTGKHLAGSSTLIIGYSANKLQLNSSGSVAINSFCFHQDRAFWALPSEGCLVHEHFVQLSAVGATNMEMVVGRFMPSGAAVMIDGVYCKITASGVFLVANNNGLETTAAPSVQFLPLANVEFKIKIIENNRQADLYINDIFYCTVIAPLGNGNLTAYPSLPICFHVRTLGVAPSVGAILRISNSTIWQDGGNTGKSAELIAATRGGNGQGQQGVTMGSVSKVVNNTQAAVNLPTNATAALGNGLGGEFHETDTLAGGNDGIISSFQNLAPTLAIPAKTLIINGISISTFVLTALTGGGYTAVWGLAWGHTAVSLATAEAVNAKAPRRKVIRSIPVPAGALANAQIDNFYLAFKNPIVVLPGEFIQVVKKKIGTAPTAGAVYHLIDFDHVFID
jgi:hypothetical protein